MARLYWAFDLATACGWASGVPGERPRAGVWRLKGAADHPAIACGNLIAQLQKHWSAEKPLMVVKEASLSLQAFKDLGNAAHVVELTLKLHGCFEGMCTRFGVPFESVGVGTVRKHFLGQSRFESRAAAKAAVVRRCQLLGFMPKDCHDDNVADAIATWDYAVATYCRKQLVGSELYLFGETAK
jgi:hypothetical protein